MGTSTRPAESQAVYRTSWGEGRVTVREGRLRWVDLPKQEGWAGQAPGLTVDSADMGALTRWVDELQEYFEGKRLSWAPADLEAMWLPSGEFTRRVFEELAAVPPGETVGYGELAGLAGHPRAARAVGAVMARNPVPVVIPCHRVIRSDGSLGWYGGYGRGTAWKERLLRHERTFAGQGDG